MRAVLSSFILITLVVSCNVPASADVSAACHAVGTESNPIEQQSLDNFINLHSGALSTLQTGVDLYVAPVDMIVSDILAVVDVAPGAGDSWVMYFVADGVRVVGLTCSIEGTETTCSTGRDSAVIPAGARLTLAVDSGEGASDPTAAASLEVSACIRRK